MDFLKEIRILRDHYLRLAPHYTMFLEVLYDLEASKIAERMIFSADEFVLQPHHILSWRTNGWLKLVDENTFPENVPCQVIVQIEKYNQLKCIFFNMDFVIPEELYEEPLLNRNLLDRHEKNGWLWIEVMIPLKDSEIKLSLSKQ